MVFAGREFVTTQIELLKRQVCAKLAPRQEAPSLQSAHRGVKCRVNTKAESRHKALSGIG